MRTEGRPTAGEVSSALVDPAKRSLVRCWGQRGTLHIYAPEDWALILAARLKWSPGGRTKFMPDAAVVADAEERVAALGRLVTRTDLLDIAPDAYVDEVEPHIRKWAKQMVKGEHTDENIRATAVRFAASRLVWAMSHRGTLCHANKVGNEQGYALRTQWFGDLDFEIGDADDAAMTLIRRYIASCGPVTDRDVAHFCGAKITATRRWLKALKPETTAIACEEKPGLFALTADIDALTEPAPTDDELWPISVLPMWDGYLMMHADKRWTTATEADEKQVWRKSAVVKSVVLQRGRAVAIWEHKMMAKRVDVTLTPLSSWTPELRAAVKKPIKAFGKHLGLVTGRLK